MEQPELIRRAAERFGSQCIVLAIDAKRRAPSAGGGSAPQDAGPRGSWELFVHGGRTATGKDAVAWAKTCQDLGAGVILPTSMDGDGTLKGYDLEFTKAISDAVTLPVVASGGAGTLEHFREGVIKGGATTLLAASVFHFRTFSIQQVKTYLKEKGLNVSL